MTRRWTSAERACYEQLQTACLPLIDHYQSDLVKLDREMISGNPGVPFLHFTRRNGTNMVFMPPGDDDCFPQRGVVRINFSCGDRKAVLQNFVNTTEYLTSGHERVSAVHLYDGTKLHKLPTDDQFKRARKIVSEYADRILEQWKEPRPCYV